MDLPSLDCFQMYTQGTSSSSDSPVWQRPVCKKRFVNLIVEPGIPCAKRARVSSAQSHELVATPREAPEGCEDEALEDLDHGYTCRIGDKIASAQATYEFQGKLGEGAWGQVLKCRSSVSKQSVALKIVKSTDYLSKFALDAKAEASFLRMVNHPHVVRMLDFFDHAGHVCIAFELLGPNLLECLEHHGHPGLSLGIIVTVTRQLLEALQHLSEVPLIHGDLKPENVMLVAAKWPFSDMRAPRVKIIDFGAAHACSRIDAARQILIQTLPYRAPEVLLGLDITCAADMWSLACLCAELFLGSSLFPHGTTERVVVCRAVRLVGPMPQWMLSAGRSTKRFYLREEKTDDDDSDGNSAGTSSWLPWRPVIRRLTRLVPRKLRRSLIGGRRPQESFQLLHDEPDASDSRDLDSEHRGTLLQELTRVPYELMDSDPCVRAFHLWPWWRCGLVRRMTPAMLEYQRAKRALFYEFIRDLLRADPHDRPSPAEALTCKLLQSQPSEEKDMHVLRMWTVVIRTSVY